MLSQANETRKILLTEIKGVWAIIVAVVGITLAGAGYITTHDQANAQAAAQVGAKLAQDEAVYAQIIEQSNKEITDINKKLDTVVTKVDDLTLTQRALTAIIKAKLGINP